MSEINRKSVEDFELLNPVSHQYHIVVRVRATCLCETWGRNGLIYKHNNNDKVNLLRQH